MLKIQLLGQFDVLHDGTPVALPDRAEQMLLAYLVLTAGIRHRREKLAGMLWPDFDESRARKNLNNYLYRLRKALGEDALDGDRVMVGWNQDLSYWVDVDDLNSGASASTPPADLFERVALYKGELLPGFYDEWVLPYRERSRVQFEVVIRRLLKHLTAGSRWEEVITWAEHWLGLDSMAEPGYRALMRAHAALGDRAALVAAYRRCKQTLDDELGVEPSEETQDLYHALLAQGPIEMPLQSPAPRPASPSVELPAQATPFIGRAQELAQIAVLLEEPTCRLVTLTGPGGVGKTRLALQAAGEHASAFTDGVFFIPLVSLDSADFLVSAIATSIRFSFYGSRNPQAQLLNHLRNMNALLVLDNFEHILEGVGLVGEMMACVPHLKLLATSRERLNLHGEWVMEVGGMDYPAAGQLAEIEEYDAIQLFVQSTRRVQPAFSLTSDGEIESVAHICQLMQGMPLGIELAAAWGRMLSTEQIVAEIEKSLEFLSTSLHDVPERHRSLWAAFDHSWQLLTVEEQAAFRRLSVFRGGFTREAAESVAGTSLPVLAALVDKSLVSRSESDRFEIHGLLRQYAASKLAESGEEERIHRTHRDWFLSQTMQSVPHLWGAAHAVQSLEWLSMERDNWRAALQWSIIQGHAEEALNQAVSLTWFWYVRANYMEGRRWLEQALELGESASPAIVAKATNHAGALAIMQQDYQRGVPLSMKAVQACYEIGNLEEVGWSLNNLGLAAMFQGDFDQAARFCVESTNIFRQIEHDGAVASLLAYRGLIACYQREYECAAALFEESLPVLHEVEDNIAIARVLFGLGLIAFHSENFDLAITRYKEALILAEEIDARSEFAQLLEGLAAAVCKLGDYRHSCVLLGASEQLRNTISTPVSIADRAVYDDCLCTIKACLDDDLFAAAWAEGKAMTAQQMLQYACGTT